MTDVGITLEIAQARLTRYLAAEADVLDGQAFKWSDRRELTKADLGEIREGIVFWSAEVKKLNPTPRAVGRMRRGFYRSR